MSYLNKVLFPWKPDYSDQFTIRDAFEGIFISGGLGSGKTSGSGAMIARSFLLQGMGGLVLTAKASELSLWQKYARVYGREKDLIIFGEGSQHKFNFLEYESSIRQDSGKGIVHNIVDTLTTVIKANDSEHGKNEEFWTNSLRSLLANALSLCLLATDKLHFDHIYKIIQSAPRSKQQLDNPEWREKSICFQMMQHAAKRLNSITKSIELEAKVRKLYKVEDYFLENWVNLSEKTRSVIEQMFFSSFADLLMEEPLYSLFNKETTVTPEDTIRAKIIVINLPYLVYEGMGKIAQILWKFIWQRAMQRRQIKENSPGAFLIADEAHHFFHQYDIQFQSTIREYRACTVYITQNLPNVYLNFGGGETGKIRFKALAGNLATKIFHANSDPETNEFAAEIIGRELGWQLSENYSTGGKPSFSQGQSESMSYKVDPHEFTLLKRGGPENNFCAEAIVHRSGKPFKYLENNNIIYENYMRIIIRQTLL